MSQILFFHNSNEDEWQSVQRELEIGGNSVFLFDTNNLSTGKTKISLDVEDGYIVSGQDTTPLSLIDSVWYQSPRRANPEIKSIEEREFAKRELTELRDQIFYLLENVYWVSHPSFVERAAKKGLQLTYAKKHGLVTPRTLLSNDPDKIRTFARSCVGGVVYKTLRYPYLAADYDRDLTEDDGIRFIGTSKIDTEHMGALDSIIWSGGIFQEYIEKEYEVRVTVVGDEVFAAKIDSQNHESEQSRIDWRHGDLTKEFVKPYMLPDEISNACKNLVRDMRLQFGGIDLIKSNSGKYVFLEVNPTGSWYWVEQTTGQPIAASIARALSKAGK